MVFEVTAGGLLFLGVVRADRLRAVFYGVRQLLGRHFTETLGEAQGDISLCLSMLSCDLFAGGAGLRFGGEEETLCRSDGAVVIRAQFKTFTPRFAFAFRSRVNQETLVELGLAVFGGELGADLSCAVVKDEFVVTAAFVFFALVAREGPVGRELAGAAEGRLTVRAVIDDTGDERAVDVVLNEGDGDFLTDSGDVLVVSGGSRTGIGDTHPGRRMIVEIRAAFGVVLCSLPVELDLYSSLFVGEDFFVGGADDGGGGESPGGGFLVEATSQAQIGDRPASQARRPPWAGMPQDVHFVRLAGLASLG